MPFLPSNNYSRARAYYGPSLEDPRDQKQYWTNYPQRLQRPIGQQWANLAAVSAGAGGLFAAGYLPFGKGRVWDKYVAGMRAFEEYSPGKIFRTFQMSAMFSPFETAVQKGVSISPELLSQNRQYTEYLSKLIGGDPYSRLLQEGVTLRKGTLYWGQTQNVALKYASAIRTAGFDEASHIGAAYARAMSVPTLKGSPPLERFFAAGKPLPYNQEVLNPLIGEMPAQIIGGKNIAQHWYRKGAAFGTEQITRFNRLLKMLPLAGKQLAVKPTGGLRMLGKLSAKFGLGLGALALGYETLDWAARRSKTLDNTLFSEGITYGLASIPVGAHIKAAEISESLGLSDYARRQEEIAPGSTSIPRLLAFPLMGSAGVGALAYGAKVSGMIQLKISENLSAAQALTRMEEKFATWERFGKFGENIGRVLESKAAGKGLFSRIARGMTPTKFGMLAGAALGAMAIAPFIPGALFPQKSPEELRDIYSGKQEVPIRKGRWWTFGRSPFEGQRIDRYQPHWYSLLRAQGREKTIWGDDFEKLSPIERWYRKEFTYELEEKHPYFPVSSLPLEDVPFVGPVLSATIGRLIKPERLMNTEHWLSGAGTKTQPPAFGGRVATEIGQAPPGKPISPFDTSQIAGEQIYRVGTEMIGLTGFVGASIKEKITGSQDWFDQRSQLESARRIHGVERWYWEKELGDPFLALTEPVRRLFPHRRRQIDLINPIPSGAPSWLPGPGEKGPDFSTGYMYSKVAQGEVRLPGPGLAALHPELEDVPYEDYSASWRMKILGDVAPYTESYRTALIGARAARAKKDGWTEADEERFQTTLKQVKRKKQKVEFQEYKYLSAMGDIIPGARQESSELMARLNEIKAAGQKKPSLSEKYFGGYWELLSHNAETAFDQLTPISPGAKLVHQRTPIESYEREILYGQSAAFWQHPVSHFLAPFARTAAHSFGYEGVPEQSQMVRDIETHFDVLKYVKNARLSNLARMAGDTQAVKQFESNKDETLFGINPFTRNYSHVLRALPRRERDYFFAFEKADTMEERQRILEMVPENEKSLYIARWKLAHADELRKAVKQGVLSEEQEAEAGQRVDEIFKEAKSEGFPTSKELMAEYLQTKAQGESYADWYRRTKILGGMENVPGPNWVGWHPSVDLEDVKLKLVQHLGEEPIPFNLWPSREKELPYKPYIDEEALKPIVNEESLTSEEMKSRINELLLTDKMKGDVFISTTVAAQDNEDILNIEVDEDRTEEEMEKLQEVLNA